MNGAVAEEAVAEKTVAEEAVAQVRETWRAHPDFSRAALEDLYRYDLKSPAIAWTLWLFTGFLGGHRLYLERTATAIVMLFTGGGAGIWWALDAIRLPKLIAAYNGEQQRRQAAGLPPIALEFMPRGEGRVAAKPAWASGRSGRTRLLGDALVLLVAGAALGKRTAATGGFEALTAILALIAITNLGARWERFARLPVLRALDRWSHRLRLFYHANDPGRPIVLLLRPIVGPVSVLRRKRGAAEVKLYLELGGVFTIAFTIVSVITALVTSGGQIEGSVKAFVRDMVQTFVMVYAFASPIGATLTRHVLLERTDVLLWLLSGLTIGAIVVGLLN